MFKFIQIVLATMLVMVGFSGVVNAVEKKPLPKPAVKEEVKTKMFIMATKNNGPLMEPVTVIVIDKTKDSRKIETIIMKHQTVLKVNPGLYLVQITWTRIDTKTKKSITTTRKREVDLRTTSSSNVIIAMD